MHAFFELTHDNKPRSREISDSFTDRPGIVHLLNRNSMVSLSWAEDGPPDSVLANFLVSFLRVKGLVAFTIRAEFDRCVCYFACPLDNPSAALVTDSTGTVVEKSKEVDTIQLFVDSVGHAAYTEARKLVLSQIGSPTVATIPPSHVSSATFDVTFMARFLPSQLDACTKLFGVPPSEKGKTDPIWTLSSTDPLYREIDTTLTRAVKSSLAFHLKVFPNGRDIPRTFVFDGKEFRSTFCTYEGLPLDPTSDISEIIEKFDQRLQQELDEQARRETKPKPAHMKRVTGADLRFAGDFLYGDYVLLYPEKREDEGIFFPKRLVEFDEKGTIHIKGWLTEGR